MEYDRIELEDRNELPPLRLPELSADESLGLAKIKILPSKAGIAFDLITFGIESIGNLNLSLILRGFLILGLLLGTLKASIEAIDKANMAKITVKAIDLMMLISVDIEENPIEIRLSKV